MPLFASTRISSSLHHPNPSSTSCVSRFVSLWHPTRLPASPRSNGVTPRTLELIHPASRRLVTRHRSTPPPAGRYSFHCKSDHESTVCFSPGIYSISDQNAPIHVTSKRQLALVDTAAFPVPSPLIRPISTALAASRLHLDHFVNQACWLPSRLVSPTRSSPTVASEQRLRSCTKSVLTTTAHQRLFKYRKTHDIFSVPPTFTNPQAFLERQFRFIGFQALCPNTASRLDLQSTAVGSPASIVLYVTPPISRKYVTIITQRLTAAAARSLETILVHDPLSNRRLTTWTVSACLTSHKVQWRGRRLKNMPTLA